MESTTLHGHCYVGRCVGAPQHLPFQACAQARQSPRRVLERYVRSRARAPACAFLQHYAGLAAHFCALQCRAASAAGSLNDPSTGAKPQNATNLAWALSTMRHQPSGAFSERLQAILLDGIKKDPDHIHPQNIGDMLQALAVLRLPCIDGLEEACEAWMRAHVQVLLPHHILAYLNVRPRLCSARPPTACLLRARALSPGLVIHSFVLNEPPPTCSFSHTSLEQAATASKCNALVAHKSGATRGASSLRVHLRCLCKRALHRK